MVKNRDVPPMCRARGDPYVKFKARGDPYSGNCKRSRASTECAHSMSFNRSILPVKERYEQLSMNSYQ
ncbi:MAG: hypothetical protein GZ094_04035 [Mariniphaga sp.]|nr:hypothetical protein [Mariniphaga sp.]